MAEQQVQAKLETEAEIIDAEEAEELEITEPEVVKEPKVNVVDATEKGGREPKPGSKKDIVFQAGRSDDGGSIKELASQMGCTPSNIRQHITQCNTKLGYGYTLQGDNFKITGDTALTWEAQEAAKPKPVPKVTKNDPAKGEELDASDEDEEGEEDEGDEDFLS